MSTLLFFEVLGTVIGSLADRSAEVMDVAFQAAVAGTPDVDLSTLPGSPGVEALPVPASEPPTSTAGATATGMLSAWAWAMPGIIFLARILDVSIGTIRVILVISGARYLAALLGFFEVVIWVLAVGSVVHNLDSPPILIGYAAGFATGTLVGMTIEDKIALGWRVVRVIAPESKGVLAPALREAGFRVTMVEGSGRDGPVDIAFSVIRRRELPKFYRVVGRVTPKAFVAVERADRPNQGLLAAGHGGAGAESRWARQFWRRPSSVRK